MDDMFMEASAVFELIMIFEFLRILKEVQGIMAFGVLFYRNYFILGTLTFVLHWINYAIKKHS
jgi:hypothetical protein